MKRRPAGYNRADFWDCNINFNLGQSESNSLVANAKVKNLDVTQNDLASFANGF